VVDCFFAPQAFPRRRILRRRDLFRRSLRHEAAALFAYPGPEVDHPVGAADEVQVVLDDDDRVPGVLQAVEQGDQARGVGRVQARRRFVEQVEGAPARAPALGVIFSGGSGGRGGALNSRGSSFRGK
jgi:hypothetical protein